MQVNFNSQEFLDLCPKFIKMVNSIKHYSTLKIKDDSGLLNKPFMMRAKQQGGHGSFQSARIFHMSNQRDMIVGVGTPADKKINLIEVNMSGIVRGFAFYKKSDHLTIVTRNNWGGHHSSRVIDIPKYNYHEFEEQMFQMSCAEEYYYLLRFFMQLQIAFNSNLYVNMMDFDFNTIFVEGTV